MHGFVVSSGTVSMTLRLLVVLCSLVVLSGDVEVNPGPGQSSAASQPKRQTARQRQLSFAQVAASPPRDPSPRARAIDSTGNADVLAYLHDMKSEVRKDLSCINGKIDDVNISLNKLKQENEELKTENKMLWREIGSIKTKVDRLEGHSRRNNLKFNGVEGAHDEKWSVTEQKVRSFIRDELNMPDLEHVDIERAHRLKTRDRQKCAIIVKFTKYKDKEAILSSAKRQLKNTPYSVYEDFTERVMTHRRELGKRLVCERERGNFAVINFDKLIVNSMVYGYDDDNQAIYEIGRARGRPGTAFQERQAETNEAGGRETGDRRTRGANSRLDDERSGDDVATAEGNID